MELLLSLTLRRVGWPGGKEHVRYHSPHSLYLHDTVFDVAKYVRGMYAVRVKGRIPDDVEAELENRGIKYRPRDQTEMD